jgi:hypothetical protein
MTPEKDGFRTKDALQRRHHPPPGRRMAPHDDRLLRVTGAPAIMLGGDYWILRFRGA